MGSVHGQRSPGGGRFVRQNSPQGGQRCTTVVPRGDFEGDVGRSCSRGQAFGWGDSQQSWPPTEPSALWAKCDADLGGLCYILERARDPEIVLSVAAQMVVSARSAMMEELFRAAVEGERKGESDIFELSVLEDNLRLCNIGPATQRIVRPATATSTSSVGRSTTSGP